MRQADPQYDIPEEWASSLRDEDGNVLASVYGETCEEAIANAQMMSDAIKASLINCALCEKAILFEDSWSPGDDAICAECDTEATGRQHA